MNLLFILTQHLLVHTLFQVYGLFSLLVDCFYKYLEVLFDHFVVWCIRRKDLFVIVCLISIHLIVTYLFNKDTIHLKLWTCTDFKEDLCENISLYGIYRSIRHFVFYLGKIEITMSIKRLKWAACKKYGITFVSSSLYLPSIEMLWDALVVIYLRIDEACSLSLNVK